MDGVYQVAQQAYLVRKAGTPSVRPTVCQLRGQRSCHWSQGLCGINTIGSKGFISPDSRRIFRRLSPVREIRRAVGAQALRPRNSPPRVPRLNENLLHQPYLHQPSAMAVYRQTVGGYSAVHRSCTPNFPRNLTTGVAQALRKKDKKDWGLLEGRPR